MPAAATRFRIDPVSRHTVDPETGCWLWTGYVRSNGYGQTGTHMAHRLIYELLVGPIPAGTEIDHKCRRPLCVNPAHLEAVPHLINMRRGSVASATNCRNGHEFGIRDWVNDPSRVDGRKRRCKKCAAAYARARRAA